MSFAIKGAAGVTPGKVILIRQGGAWVPVKAARDRRAGSAWVEFYTSEVVATVSSPIVGLVLKSLFSSADWGNADLRKRVVIAPGVEVGAASAVYALAPTITADGLAGSWAGELVLENYGFISGLGGLPNGGNGGDAIWMNFPGRANQKMKLRSSGTIRAGGGGGGRAGNGGAGDYITPITEGPAYAMTVSPFYGWIDTPGYSAGFFWNSEGWTANFSAGTTSWYDGATWTYHRGSLAYNPGTGSYYYAVYRTRPTTSHTSGGIAGNGGRGQGYDGAATAGAGAVAGGTNAGSSGVSGNGGNFGQSGAAGSAGAGGNNGSGTAGQAGGVAGLALSGSAHIEIVVAGTMLGR